MAFLSSMKSNQDFESATSKIAIHNETRSHRRLHQTQLGFLMVSLSPVD